MTRNRASRPPSSAPIRSRTGSARCPSEQALIDATRVVIHTQEQAGIDLVCDGELYRFDVNHPETNGMIEYFVRPMAGIRTAVTFDELVAYRAQRGMGFRTRPPAVVEGPVGPGTLDLPQACARAQAARRAAVQVHADRPAHAGQDAATTCTTATCPTSRWRSPTRSPSRCGTSTPTSCRSTRPTCRAARTNGNGRRRRSTACSTPSRPCRPCICASATTAARSIQKGTLGAS